jgi:hypothetical protein
VVSARCVFALVVCVLLMSSNLGCLTDNGDDEDNGDEKTVPVQPFSMTSVRADFKDPVYEPVLPDYTLPLQASEVRFLERLSQILDLTDDQVQFLLENGLLGISDLPLNFTRFYDAYDRIFWRYDLPLLYTSDAVLDAFHHIFEGMMVTLEGSTLFDELYNFTERMMVLSQKQYNDLPKENKQLALDNIIFFGTALRLLDPDVPVKWFAEDEIDRMVGFIKSARGTIIPPGFSQLEDLTQYEPRSHYTYSDKLSRYFRAMMWYGRLTFSGDSDNETRRAILVSMALRDDHVANTSYSKVMAMVRFLVGFPDDLTYLEYADAVDQVFDVVPLDFSPIFDDNRLDILQRSLKELRPPKINSDMTAPGQTVWGLRLMGQAYVIGSYVFQRCTSENVPGRYVPSALDVMAALGSEEAWDREDFESYQPDFEDNLGELREEVATYEEDYWNSSIYNGWLHCLQALDQNTSDPDLPAYMGTDAWAAKQLNTQMGSWTQLTHDTQLYRKQTYTYMGIASPPPEYVEPVPELYSRMADIIKTLVDGMDTMGFLTPTMRTILGNFWKVLNAFEEYAIAELELREPEFDSETMIHPSRAYEYMVWEPTHGETYEGRTVLVSDVHTLHNAAASLSYLEEAVGYVKLLVVVAPSPDGHYVCVGPVFEHFEFSRDGHLGRLTDEEWEGMLENGTAPEPAPWAKDFNP